MTRSSSIVSSDFDLTINRSLLSEQATERLRSAIISGVISPGSRLVEEDLAQILGVSRVPTREALNALEREGLVVRDGRRRCVYKPTKKDIEEIYEVRRSLEKLATSKAAHNTNPENRAALLEKLQELKIAIASGDYVEFITADMAIHRQVWEQAGNAHLLRTLSFLVGLIFMVTFDYWHRVGRWGRNEQEHDLRMHRNLVEAINAGDSEAAEKDIERHCAISAVSRLTEGLQSGI